MKRLLLAVAVLGALSVTAPAVADGPDTTFGSPVVSDVLSPQPSDDWHHVCVIYDKLDWYRCVYIPAP